MLAPFAREVRMGHGVPYSARKQDLFYPAKNLKHFPGTCPRSDAELCAWMSLHVCDPLYIDRHRKIAPNPGVEFMASDRLRATLSYILKYAWKPGNQWWRNLTDHAPINYATAMAGAPPPF